MDNLSSSENQNFPVLFHGTNVVFETFDESLIGTGDSICIFGDGYYFTDNFFVADFYAQNKALKKYISGHQPTGILKTLAPVYQPGAEAAASYDKQILSFRVNVNFLVLESFQIDEQFKEYILDSWVRYSGFAREDGVYYFAFLKINQAKIHNYRGDLGYIISKLAFPDKRILEDIVNYVRNLGYSGIKYRCDVDFEGNASSGHNYVVYDKTLVSRVDLDQEYAERLIAAAERRKSKDL